MGGGANAEQIKNAFRILLADTDVKAVLINIFGGILRCDVLAEGVIAAVRDLTVKVPVVVRMKGNNEEKGKEMLQDSGLNFVTADDMTDAAEKVVAAAREVRGERPRRRATRALLVQGMGKHGTFHARAAATTARRSSAASRPARAAPRSRASRSSTPSQQAVDKTGANVSVIFVPPAGAADAILEAADAGHRRSSSASPRASRRSTW